MDLQTGSFSLSFGCFLVANRKLRQHLRSTTSNWLSILIQRLVLKPSGKLHLVALFLGLHTWRLWCGTRSRFSERAMAAPCHACVIVRPCEHFMVTQMTNPPTHVLHVGTKSFASQGIFLECGYEVVPCSRANLTPTLKALEIFVVVGAKLCITRKGKWGSNHTDHPLHLLPSHMEKILWDSISGHTVLAFLIFCKVDSSTL
jgi:hypothetical protein